MATTETTSTVHARHTYDRRQLFHKGVTGTEEHYGVVQIVRTTKTQRYSEEATGRRSGRNRLGEPVEEVEVLATLDANEAEHLILSLVRQQGASLRVRPAYHDRTR